jgi:hypothetical protein
MNCSIVKLDEDGTTLRVIDQLGDRSISSRRFFENCFTTLTNQLNLNQNKIIYYKLMNDLYSLLNTNRSQLATASTNADNKDVWYIELDGQRLALNMRQLGAPRLADSIISKLKRTYLIDLKTQMLANDIRHVLVCSDAIIHEYFEPLIRACCDSNTDLTFVDNDSGIFFCFV